MKSPDEAQGKPQNYEGERQKQAEFFQVQENRELSSHVIDKNPRFKT